MLVGFLVLCLDFLLYPFCFYWFSFPLSRIWHSLGVPYPIPPPSPPDFHPLAHGEGPRVDGHQAQLEAKEGLDMDFVDSEFILCFILS